MCGTADVAMAEIMEEDKPIRESAQPENKPYKVAPSSPARRKRRTAKKLSARAERGEAAAERVKGTLHISTRK